MKRFTAGEIASALAGELVQGDSGAVFDRISTDTRTISRGDLFIALAGERFDAHEFTGTALEAGAGGLVVSQAVETGGWKGPVILVRDTLKALQDLAGYNRRQFAGLVAGVTGSNGKTTTKDMIASVLEQKYLTLKTQGNFNNHIGLPLTLLKLDDSYGAAVLEMGMRGLGEIDLLASIAKPGCAVITNIGETHLECLGSVENIARAKGEILDHVPPEGLAVLNGDDPLVRGQAHRCRGRVVYYGTGGDAAIRAIWPDAQSGTGALSRTQSGDGRCQEFRVITPAGEVEICLPVPGRHNVLNALAAVGVGLEAGLSLEELKRGLESVTLTSQRLEIVEGPRATVINDAYNANPASVKAALRILAELGKGRRKVAVLGDMYELGARTVQGHREVGAEAAAQKVDVLITVGRLAGEIALGASFAEEPPTEIISLNTNAEVKKYVKRIILSGDVVLVKGSRGMKMEEIADEVLALEA